MVRGDSLYWVADLFVTSDEYPLSEAVMFAGAPRHYVRKAATAFVQAQTGRVTIVAETRPDVVTQSWMRRFPWLFVPRAELSAGLDSLRPPPWIGRRCRRAPSRGPDLPRDSIAPRSLAPNDDADADVAGGGPTFFAPLGEHGPLAWSLGVVDAGHAGDRRARRARRRRRRAPSGTGRRRRRAVELRSSRRCSTRRTAPASAISGGSRAAAASNSIPAAAGVAYVQTFYEWPPDGPPSIAGVVRARSTAGSGPVPRLSEALGVTHPPSGGATESLRARIAALYDAMSAALRRGDWRAFGQAYSQLGTLLRTAP